MSSSEPLYYADYLMLDRLLSSQELESAKHGRPVHDEMLFIIIHQAYELWFKQITWELDSIMQLLAQPTVDEKDMGTIVGRLRRIVAIQGLLIDQIEVLETMTPMDFLDFRDFLYPASGFQSAQFRIVENKLGVRREDRLKLEGAVYTERLNDDDRERVESYEAERSLFDLVEAWLERTPFLDQGDFDFWKSYQEAVLNRIEMDRKLVATNPNLTEGEIEAQNKDFDAILAQYEAVFDPERHAHEVAAGRLRLSHRAFQAALFICLYRDEPALQLPFQMLELLMDVDEGFTMWRYRHAQMTLRMIGGRIGTGGSAGAKYLQRSAERTRVYGDLFNLSTFLVPRVDRPDLPDEILESMRFRYQQ